MIKTCKKSILFLILGTVILVIILFNIVLNLNLPSPDYEYRKLSLPDNFNLPDARVIAIGTATHGNAEPFDITLEMLQKIKKERGHVAFVLEEQVGVGAIVNQTHSFYDYEQKKHMGFYDMYTNEEMNRLLSWIKSEDVNFYGVDFQFVHPIVDFVENFLNEKGYSDTNIAQLRSNANLKYEMQVKERIIDKIENKMNELLISKSIEEREFDYILHLINCIRKNYEYVLGGKQGSVRDQMMAENVLWVMEHELKYYSNENIVLFAHNGHIMEDDFELGNGNMHSTIGQYLSNYLGDDYYSIVTEAKKNSFLARESIGKRKIFSIERTGLLVDTIGADSPSIKFCTSEYLKQSGISAWDLTIIGWYFDKMRTFRPAHFTINTNVETCFDAMLYFDQLTPNIDCY